MNNYSRKNPFLSAIKRRTQLSDPSTGKNTQHIVLDIAGSGITYAPGDCVAVLPDNPNSEVDALLKRLNLNDPAFRSFLTKKANLNRVPKDAENLSPQELMEKFPPLLPRFYSIASSMAAVGEEIHLTVRHVEGVCSQFLCETAPLEEQVIPLYIQPGLHFALPEEDVPIIMIGPGTGIAPYRAFLQERAAQSASGLNWLFFGEWTSTDHFFYEEEWASHPNLRLTTAFSRDQEEKVYVQHKIAEHADELRDWIEDGAYIYVCGDAKSMAPAVEKALCTIIDRDHLKALRKAKRYRRDIY